MNIKLTVKDNIDELLTKYNLSLWSKIQHSETIFIIEMDNKSVGYIAYEPLSSTISKFEIVEPYRNKGIGTKTMKKFLNEIRPYTNKVILHPISDDLFGYYKKLGFRKKPFNKYDMIYKY